MPERGWRHCGAISHKGASTKCRISIEGWGNTKALAFLPDLPADTPDAAKAEEAEEAEGAQVVIPE